MLRWPDSSLSAIILADSWHVLPWLPREQTLLQPVPYIHQLHAYISSLLRPAFRLAHDFHLGDLPPRLRVWNTQHMSDRTRCLYTQDREKKVVKGARGLHVPMLHMRVVTSVLSIERFMSSTSMTWHIPNFWYQGYRSSFSFSKYIFVPYLFVHYINHRAVLLNHFMSCSYFENPGGYVLHFV